VCPRYDVMFSVCGKWVGESAMWEGEAFATSAAGSRCKSAVAFWKLRTFEPACDKVAMRSTVARGKRCKGHLKRKSRKEKAK
jgi:hypothetical protein